MQKGKEKYRYVGQCVTYEDLPKSNERIKRRKTNKGSERSLTFSPVISLLDKYAIEKLENVFLSLLSILDKYTNINLEYISKFNQQELINFLNSNLQSLLKAERHYFNYDNIIFNGKSVILYYEEPEVGNCITLSCIDKVEDENLKKIIRYVIGSLIIRYNYSTAVNNDTFLMTMDYWFSEDNEENTLEISQKKYQNDFKVKLKECTTEFINGTNEWHYDYIMEIPNHTKQIKKVLEMVNHYKSFSCEDFSFSELIGNIKNIEDEDTIVPFQSYMCILPLDDEIFDEYEHHLNDYWNNYEFERLVYKKEYSLDGIVNTTKHFETLQYIKKLTDYLWQI